VEKRTGRRSNIDEQELRGGDGAKGRWGDGRMVVGSGSPYTIAMPSLYQLYIMHGTGLI